MTTFALLMLAMLLALVVLGVAADLLEGELLRRDSRRRNQAHPRGWRE